MFKKAEELCRRYKSKVDGITKEHGTEVEFINKNFIGSLKTEKMLESDSKYQRNYRAEMQSYIDEAQKIVDGMRASIKSKVNVMDTKSLNEISSLRGIQLTGSEIQALAEKYHNDYYSLKALKQIADEQGFHVNALSMDDLLYVVAEFENDLTKIAYYAGNEFANDAIVRVSQFEHPFVELEQKFNVMGEGVISVTKKPEVKKELTASQKDSLVRLFKGYELDMDARAKELVDLGLKDVIVLSDDYRPFLPKEEAKAE